MGYAKNKAQEAKDGQRGGSGRRGSTNNTGRLAAFKDRSTGGSAEWASCDSDLLLAVIDKITGMGGAITIGLARDQGAHSLTLLLDGSRATFWYNGDAVLDDKLREVLATLEEM